MSSTETSLEERILKRCRDNEDDIEQCRKEIERQRKELEGALKCLERAETQQKMISHARELIKYILLEDHESITLVQDVAKYEQYLQNVESSFEQGLATVKKSRVTSSSSSSS
jgi:flagellar biosynthesis chaperone FliJ